jgi:hypothetical protein
VKFALPKYTLIAMLLLPVDVESGFCRLDNLDRANRPLVRFPA